ncbi:MAG: tol-pal system YbgF family protein [Bacteriovoracia bacterium]
MTFSSFSALFFAFSLCTGCTANPMQWWASINAKAQHLASVEAKYEALVVEHERLEKEYFQLEHEHSSLTAQVQSKELAGLNLAATGSALGRNPASIAYVPPKGLKMDDLLSLAYEHMREKRFAEAAVTFEDYLSKPEAAGQNGDAIYASGVAWFELGNYRKARESFESAKLHASGETAQKIHKKVDLWLRVIDRKIGQGSAKAVNAHGG